MSAMSPAITLKGSNRSLIVLRFNRSRMWGHAARIFAITIKSQYNNSGKRYHFGKQSWFFGAVLRCGLALDAYRTLRANQILCPFFPAVIQLDFKREHFTDNGALSILWKSRNVDENLGSALRRCDESESTIVVPFAKSAFNTHKEFDL